MLRLKYSGWFQCLLPTDPDPADEPRGVSGYMRALPGEPDFDRVIRFQNPTFSRSHTPRIGVHVEEVKRNGELLEDHALLGATVELLGNPVFLGENGLVAEDGYEPIVPFTVQLRRDHLKVIRSPSEDSDFVDFPYKGLQAGGVILAPGMIADATGVPDVLAYLGERIARLEADAHQNDDPTLLDNIRRRIELLKSPNGSRFFGAMMRYAIPLEGTVEIEDPEGSLDRPIDPESRWFIDFWFGGWDSDAAAGFTQGFISIPEIASHGDEAVAPLVDISGVQPGTLS